MFHDLENRGKPKITAKKRVTLRHDACASRGNYAKTGAVPNLPISYPVNAAKDRGWIGAGETALFLHYVTLERIEIGR